MWAEAGLAISGIRRNTEPRIFLLEALVVIYAFTAAAFRSDWPSIGKDPAALARLAIPAAATLFGLLLRDAYTDTGQRPPHAAAVDVVVAFACAFVSQLALFVLRPELALPRWAPTQGGFVGISLAVACRALFPPDSRLPANGGAMSLPEVRSKAEELAERIRVSRRAYLAVAGLSSLLCLYFLFAGGAQARLASCLILVGALYLLSQIGAGVTPVVAGNAGQSEWLNFYRLELQRQLVFLARTGNWYYASLLPGLVVALLGSRVYPYWLPLVALMAAELNRRAAEKLQGELNEVGAAGLIGRGVIADK